MLFGREKYNYLDMIVTYIKLVPSMALLKILYSVIDAVLPTISIVLTALFINNAVGVVSNGKPVVDAFIPLVGMLLIKLFQQYTGVAFSLMGTRASAKLQTVVQPEILRSKACVKYKYYENQDCVDVLTRATDAFQQNMQGFFDQVFTTFSLAAQLAGLIVILGLQLWWVAILFVCTSIPAFVIAYRFGEKKYDVDKEMTKVDRRAWYISDLLRGRDTLEERRLFGYTDRMNEEYRRNFLVAAKAREKVTRHMWFDTTLAGILVFASGVLVIAFLIPQLIPQNGQAVLSIGLFISLVNAIFGLSAQMQETIPDHINAYRYQFEYLKDLNTYLSFASEEANILPPARQGIALEKIEFKNVSFRYPGCETYILKDFNLVLEANRHYALVGTNGAGKTTLIKILTGLYDDYEGEILINGKELRSFSAAELKATVAAIYQDYCRYPLDMYHNIAIGNLNQMEDREKTEQAAATMGLSTLISRLPNGIDTSLTKIEEDGVDLSGGEWQRIAIARLLVSAAPLKILDEPTAALDPIAESRLYEQFHDIMQLRDAHGMTLFISHRLGMTKCMDTIIVLENGKVKECGSHTQLMEQNGLYAEMFRSQSQWYIEKEETGCEE